MGILSTGFIHNLNGEINTESLMRGVDSLPDGTHKFILFNHSTNPMLPALRYITGYLVPDITAFLKKKGYNISGEALYRYFEQEFTPPLTEEIMGEMVTYHNLKGMKTKELSEVADKIIKWAEAYGMEFVERADTKGADFSDKYAEIYAEQWKNLKEKFKL